MVDDMKIRLRSGKLAGGLGLLLALGLIVALAVPALAVPQPPHQFFGTVTIGATLAPEGTIVSAQIDGVEYESGTVDTEGRYGYDPLDLFKVPADDPGTPAKEGGVPGETVEFYITNDTLGLYEVPADEEALFEIWGTTNLDLTVPAEIPQVSTAVATDITTNSATLNGSLDSLGDYTSVDVSFVWGDAEGGPYPNETTPAETKTETGAFSAPISGLASNSTYYFRAKATGSITVYGDELSFTTTGEDTPPTVVSTWPVDGAADVAVNTVVSATFNEPIDEATIVFALDSVSGILTYADTTATFTPDTNLDYSTTYSASIQASDLAGNPMAVAYTWSFTTQEFGTLSLVEGVNIIAYTGVTADLPGALTNIGPGGLDVVDGLWARGAWTGGEWLFYNARIQAGTLSELEADRGYIIVVTEDCTWELPQ